MILTRKISLWTLYFFISCNVNNREVIQYYEDSKIVKSKIEVSEDQIWNGEYVGYYRNGSIKEIGFYKEGLLTGKFIEYYINGNIKSLKFFKAGVIDSIQLVYSETLDSTLLRQFHYTNGIRTGNAILYYPNKYDYIFSVMDGDTIYSQIPLIKRYEFYNGSGDLTFYEEYSLEGEIKSDSGSLITSFNYDYIDSKIIIGFDLPNPRWNERKVSFISTLNGNTIRRDSLFINDGYSIVEYGITANNLGLYEIDIIVRFKNYVLNKTKMDSMKVVKEFSSKI